MLVIIINSMMMMIIHLLGILSNRMYWIQEKPIKIQEKSD